MVKVLLTAGRTLGCLELARQLHRAGDTVFVAESFRSHLCHRSRAVTREYVVPSASRDTEAYVQALSDIIDGEGIELLIPTCEEIFFIAAHRKRLEDRCRLLLDDLDKLILLHNKWTFVEWMEELGLPVPRSTLLTSRQDLDDLTARNDGRDNDNPKIVLKPAYSRFAAQTVLYPGPQSKLSSVRPTPLEPWVAQQYIEGRGISTYSIAHEGRLAAHVAYPIEFALWGGPTVVYSPMRHSESLRIAEELADALSLTGQFGIDFIETEDGMLYAIECNPRTTGGVHCFDGTPEFRSALLGMHHGTLFPTILRTRVVAWAMLTGLLFSLRSFREFRSWVRIMLTARDIVYRSDDRWPAIQQHRTFGYFRRLARRKQICIRNAMTWDLAFNGRESLEPRNGPL